MLCDEDKNITQYVEVELPTNCPIAPLPSDGPPPSDTLAYYSVIGGHLNTMVIIWTLS